MPSGALTGRARGRSQRRSRSPPDPTWTPDGPKRYRRPLRSTVAQNRPGRSEGRMPHHDYPDLGDQASGGPSWTIIGVILPIVLSIAGAGVLLAVVIGRLR